MAKGPEEPQADGYTVEIAVSDDHIVVAPRVHQAPADNGSLNQMTKLIEQQSGRKPRRGGRRGWRSVASRVRVGTRQ